MPLLDIRHQFVKISEFSLLLDIEGKLKLRRSLEFSSIPFLTPKARLFALDIVDKAKHYQNLLLTCSEDRMPIPDGMLSGNMNIYSCISNLMSLKVDLSEYVKDIRFCSRIMESRKISGSSKEPFFKFTDDHTEVCIIKFMALNDILIDMHRSSVYNYELLLKAIDKGDIIDIKSYNPTISHDDISLTVLGPLVIIIVKSERFVFSHEHYERLLESLIKFRNYLLLIINLLGPEDKSGLYLLRRILSLGVMYPEKIGEGMKAARNSLVWRLSQDTMMGNKPEKLLFSSYDEWKVDIAEKVLDIYDDLGLSTYDQLQVAYAYKYIPHPDSDMSICFISTLGVKEANKVEINSLKALEGSLRKSLFSASVKTGEPLRVIGGDEYLKNVSSFPSPNYDDMIRVGTERWSSVRFSLENRYADYLNKDLKTLDRAHCKEPKIKDIGENLYPDIDYLRGKSRPRKKLKTLFGKDIILKYKDNEEPSAVEAWAYFRRIVDAHTKLEEKLGYRPSSRELSDFYIDNPDAFHWVATEGKYGEAHKETTRMFYLANPYMKKYLSLVERLIKDITKGQLGNSITKTYEARDSDKRTFAHSSSSPAGNYIPIYLSFDMSEFSKRFPGENLMILGKILSELTGDPTLSRLDIAFRSAIVAHSTRGVEGKFAGVTGGFEGFLNFGWTTIHVAIMIVALKEAGVSGAILAYSDDGVLYFLIDSKDTMDKVREVVLVIQAAYRKLGLNFHIGKTLVSTTTFEYLGDISDDGRLIDSWPKSLSSLCIIDKKDSFSPIGSVIDSYVGQVGAIVNNGFPAALLEPYLMYHVYLKLKRLTSRLKIDDAVALMIIPRSSGGFGLPCSYNFSISYEKDNLAEFIADCESIGSIYPKIESKICSYVYESLREGSEYSQSLILGNMISTTIKDITGIDVLAKAGNMLRKKVRLR